MKHAPNIICLTGLSAILYGLWTFYAPLMWLVLGVLVCAVGIVSYRKRSKP